MPRHWNGWTLLFLLTILLMAKGAQAQELKCRPAVPPVQPVHQVELNLVLVDDRIKTIKMEKEVFECGTGNPFTRAFTPRKLKDVEILTEEDERVEADRIEGIGGAGQRFKVIICVKDIARAFTERCSTSTPPLLRSIPQVMGCSPAANQPPAVSPLRSIVKTTTVQKELFSCPRGSLFVGESLTLDIGQDFALLVDINTFATIIERLKDGVFQEIANFIGQPICVKAGTNITFNGGAVSVQGGDVLGCGFFPRPPSKWPHWEIPDDMV